MLVAATLADIVVTVIGVSGGHGKISSVVCRGLWNLSLSVHRRRPSHQFLRAAGPASVIAVTLAWTAFLVVGWALVFAPSGALEATDLGGAVGVMDRLDHAAAMVLGGSSALVTSEGQPWSLVSRLARFTGLGLASLGVAYALPVVGSVVRYRRLARSIGGLRGDDDRILTTAQLESEDSLVHLFLINLSSDLALAAEELRAYPIVPFFHSREPDSALSVSCRDLVDYLERRDPASTSVPASVIQPLTNSLDAVLDVIDAYFLPEPFGVDLDEPERARRRRVDAWAAHDGWGGEIPPPHGVGEALRWGREAPEGTDGQSGATTASA